MTKTVLVIVGVLLAGGLAYLAVQGARRLFRPTVLGVGDVPEFTFARPVLGRPDLRSSADLHGRPTLVITWGTG